MMKMHWEQEKDEKILLAKEKLDPSRVHAKQLGSTLQIFFL
jgi:hypothetical protein